jgi:hypothetical protein
MTDAAAAVAVIDGALLRTDPTASPVSTKRRCAVMLTTSSASLDFKA